MPGAGPGRPEQSATLTRRSYIWRVAQPVGSGAAVDLRVQRRLRASECNSHGPRVCFVRAKGLVSRLCKDGCAACFLRVLARLPGLGALEGWRGHSVAREVCRGPASPPAGPLPGVLTLVGVSAAPRSVCNWFSVHSPRRGRRGRASQTTPLGSLGALGFSFGVISSHSDWRFSTFGLCQNHLGGLVAPWRVSELSRCRTRFPGESGAHPSPDPRT